MRSVSLVDGHIDRMTNYDRIKNMSKKELANFLQQNHFNSWFFDEILEYLERDVDTE